MLLTTENILHFLMMHISKYITMPILMIPIIWSITTHIIMIPIIMHIILTYYNDAYDYVYYYAY